MFEPSSTASDVSPSFFHHQSKTLFPKFLDGSFNNNTTTFGPRPKFLDNCFNGNKTTLQFGRK